MKAICAGCNGKRRVASKLVDHTTHVIVAEIDEPCDLCKGEGVVSIKSVGGFFKAMFTGSL